MHGYEQILSATAEQILVMMGPVVAVRCLGNEHGILERRAGCAVRDRDGFRRRCHDGCTPFLFAGHRWLGHGGVHSERGLSNRTTCRLGRLRLAPRNACGGESNREPGIRGESAAPVATVSLDEPIATRRLLCRDLRQSAAQGSSVRDSLWRDMNFGTWRNLPVAEVTGDTSGRMAPARSHSRAEVLLAGTALGFTRTVALERRGLGEPDRMERQGV